MHILKEVMTIFKFSSVSSTAINKLQLSVSVMRGYKVVHVLASMWQACSAFI